IPFASLKGMLRCAQNDKRRVQKMRRRSAERKLMRSDLISRRALLSQVGGAAALSMTLSAIGPNRAEAQSRPMRLGGPIFVKSDDPAVLAKAHRDLGYRAAYAPEVSLTDKDRINAIIKEFAAQDVA